MPFSSKDFATTSAILESELPGRLVHRDVRQRFHGGFSQERGHGVAIVDLPSRSISVTIGHLKEGQRTRLHRHNYETIIYVVKGCGYSLVENEKVEWKAGDALYVRSGHGIDTSTPATTRRSMSPAKMRRYCRT